MGMPGFSDTDADLPLILGEITGYRGWDLQWSPAMGPKLVGAHWTPWGAVPRAQRSRQESLLYKARCNWLDEHPDTEETPDDERHGSVPSRNCPSGCGFWAYWEPGVSVYSHEVTGIIKGLGKLVRGPTGFRAGQARIIALCLTRRPEHLRKVGSVREARRLLEIKWQVPVFSSQDDMIATFPVIPQPPEIRPASTD